VSLTGAGADQQNHRRAIQKRTGNAAVQGRRHGIADQHILKRHHDDQFVILAVNP
jgi:hypothetical protein